MELIESIELEIRESISVKTALSAQAAGLIAEVARTFVTCLQSGNKLVFFGNGGSATDAQHLAAEFVGRYRIEREGLAAIALTESPAILTAMANDYAFEQVFSRQVQALGKKGDVAVALSTSGNSGNVLQGIAAAKVKGMRTVGLTGKSGGKMREQLDICICVPSESTPRIQEAHMLVGHILSGIVENCLCGVDSVKSEKLSAVKAPR